MKTRCGGDPGSGRPVRGWRNTVGNLVEIRWPKQSPSRASSYRYMRETQRGTVSSNSRFRTVLFRQHSANLSARSHAAASLPGVLVTHTQLYIYIYIYNDNNNYHYHYIYIYIYIRMSSEQRDPNPNNNSLVRRQCCKRRGESLTCRCVPSLLRNHPEG